jgi:hypothetical protein
MARSLPPALAVAPILLMMAAACSGGTQPPGAAPVRGATAEPSPSLAATPAPRATRAERSSPLNRWVTRRPPWLGTRVLPLRPDGFGVVQPTPAILRNRRLPTTDLLPRPKSGRFVATTGPVPRSVVERSTWRPKCPVSLDQLSYLTMTFWGFDHLPHTGEMIVNASVDEQIVGVFRALYEARFPIEEMRVVTLKEQRAQHTAPTGDSNVTSSFECRRATLGSTWSQHAYGLAIDVNPFHNPYFRGDLVAPELALAYSNREWRRPGMVFEGDIATRAFDAIGWGWGGSWSSLKDWMHFSQSGH